MRIAVTFFLGVLLVIVAGLGLGFLSLDLSAPEDTQLTATGALAYYDCYWEGECEVDPYYEEPLDVYEYAGTYWDNEGPVDVYEYGWTESAYPEDFYPENYYSEEAPYDPYWEEEYGWGGTWVEEEWVEAPRAESPWYVSSFPGFGQVIQQIVPGLQVSAPRPSPAPPPRPLPPPPPSYPQPSCSISVHPQPVSYGGSFTLEWQAYNATRAELEDVGQVPTSGSRHFSEIARARTYALEVSGPGGRGNCYTLITIKEPPAGPPPSCIISAHPQTIERGEASSLAWGSNNASSATLSGVGAVSVSGGRYVSPSQSTTYTLSVSDSKGRSGTCVTKVTVLP